MLVSLLFCAFSDLLKHRRCIYLPVFTMESQTLAAFPLLGQTVPVALKCSIPYRSGSAAMDVLSFSTVGLIREPFGM